MRASLPLIVSFLLMSFAGCANVQLKHSTVNQAKTLTDLQHRQVLNNLAAIACNPAAIPFHVNLHDGTTSVTDNGSIETQVLGDADLGLGANRSIVDQWSMTPVTDDTTLKLLRIAYRRALGSPEDLYTSDLANDLAHDLKKQTGVVDDLRTLNQLGALQVAGNQRDPAEVQRDAKALQELRDRAIEPIDVQIRALETQESALRRQLETTFTDAASTQLAQVERDRASQEARKQGVEDRFNSILISLASQEGLTPPQQDGGYTAFEIRRAVKISGSIISTNDDRIIQKGERLTDENLLFPPVIKPETGQAVVLKADGQMAEVPVNPMTGLPLDVRLQNTSVVPLFKKTTPNVVELRRQVKEVNNELLRIGTGWVGRGCKKDVPKGACYVAHHSDCGKDCYVWVCPQESQALEEFTLTVLKLSALIKETQVLSVPGVRYTPGMGGFGGGGGGVGGFFGR